MLQSATGSLTLIDVNTEAPSVFWRGQRVTVDRVSVVENKVFLRVPRDSLDPAIAAEMTAEAITIKEV